MPLVDVRGFKLGGDQFDNATQGFDVGRKIAQFGRESEVRNLLSQAQEPPTQQQSQLAEQSAGLGQDNTGIPNKEDLIRQAKQVDPLVAEKMLNSLGFTDDLKRAEASRFSAQLQNTPFEQRGEMINARAQSLQQQGRDSKDTIELLDLSEADQNKALTGVQLADLSTRDRFAMQSKNKSGKGLASAVTKINEDGSSIQSLPSGEVIARNPLGDIVTGQERLAVIENAKQAKQSRLQAESNLSISEKNKIESDKQRIARSSRIIEEISTRNRESSRSKVQLRKALNLAKTASQGLTGAAKLQLSRIIPGIDASDEGALDAALKELSLVQLQNFKGPTTDFEFSVTQDISGALGQSKEANIARVKSLDRNAWFNKREGQQFRKFMADGNNPDEFTFNFQEPIKTKQGTFTLQDIQDTAVANTLTIEETLRLLNK